MEELEAEKQAQKDIIQNIRLIQEKEMQDVCIDICYKHILSPPKIYPPHLIYIIVYVVYRY